MRFETTNEIPRYRIGAQVHPLRDAFLRALVTGGAGGGLVAVIGRLWRYPIDDAIMGGVAAGLLVFLIAWCRPRSSEPAMDPPQPAERSGRVVLLSPRANAEPPSEAERLTGFVKACQVDTSTRRLETLGYGRDEIERFRDYLIRSGWAQWRGPDRRQGWELTGGIDEILEALE